MATLNIKNMPEKLYRKLQARARSQHRSVAQEVKHILAEVLERPALGSILELRGLGKQHWKDLDVSAHIRSERSSWD